MALSDEIDSRDAMRQLLVQRAPRITIRYVPADQNQPLEQSAQPPSKPNFAEYGLFADPNEPAVDFASYGEPVAPQQLEQPVVAPASPPDQSPGLASYLCRKAAEAMGGALQPLKRFVGDGRSRG